MERNVYIVAAIIYLCLNQRKTEGEKGKGEGEKERKNRSEYTYISYILFTHGQPL